MGHELASLLFTKLVFGTKNYDILASH